MSFRQAFRSAAGWYERLMARQGFGLPTLICLGVIVGSAIWTGQSGTERAAPTPPVQDAASAAELWQQSLRDAATPTPAPSPEPLMWQAPLEKTIVLRAFDAARLVQSAVTGVWQLHDAVDLAANQGEIVRAMADGTVVSAAEEGLCGASVVIAHPGGYEAEYSALALLASLRAGDPVKAGQTIGFAGNSMIGESNMGAHLHLRVTREGKAVDPMILLR